MPLWRFLRGAGAVLEEEDSPIETISDKFYLNITCIVGKDEEKTVFGFKGQAKNSAKSALRKSSGTIYRGTAQGTDPGDRIQHHCVGGCKPGSSVIAAGYRCAGKPARNAYAAENGRPRILYCSA